jgi:cytochrome c peroxidase
MRTFKSKSVVVIAAIAATVMAFVGASSFTLSTEETPHPYELKYNIALYPEPNIPADNALTAEGIWLGRLLFHDPLLSGNGTQSCSSCHQQKYSFTDGKPLAIGSLGDTLTRSTMPLMNLAWRNQFFWDGRVKTLEQLVMIPVTHPQELAKDTAVLLTQLLEHKQYPALFQKAFPGEKISMQLLSKAIAQFCYTIVSPGIALPSHILKIARDSVAFKHALKEESMNGTWIRFSETCGRCHGDGLYGNANTLATNGLVSIDSTNGGMIVPPLLNLKYTQPFMHDGRFTNLKDVFAHYNKQLPNLHKLNNQALLNKRPIANILLPYDKLKIEEFLTSFYFTDTNIVVNPAFGNPFVQYENPWVVNPYIN